MPYKSREKQLEYWRQYGMRNRKKITERQRVWQQANKEYLREWQRAYKARNRDKIRAWYRQHHRRKTYGLSEVEYAALVVQQGGKCGICEKDESECGDWKLTVDHDHQTGRVRGLLCIRCNRGLGLIGDAVEVVRAAVQYLEAYAAKKET